MNTSAAATKANVTVGTIRIWCRIGAVTATKSSGRWNIDQASLDHRITLSAKPATPKPLTADAVIALGGSRWTKNGCDRVYLNNWAEFAGFDMSTYSTGNVSYFALDGRRIANSRIHRVLGPVEKVYFDAADGRLYVKHHGARDVEIRYYDGGREQIDLVQRICDGIRSAAANL